MDELSREFMDRGHHVAIAAGLDGKGMLAFRNRILMKLSRKRVIRDYALGYPVFRAWFIWEAMEEIAQRFRPDVVFAQSGFPARIATACQKLGIPTAIYLRNVESHDLGGDLSQLRGVRYVANSSFTAQRFREKYGIESTVVHPLFRRSRYETTLTRKNVTFVNPHVEKGVDLALEVARCSFPIPFTFVEAWNLDAQVRRDLLRRIAEVPNIKLKRSTHDMRSVYRDARIVMVPSKWEEGFGRVAVEAQISGIPVIATRIGGLPEAVGPGGILIGSEAPVEAWVEAIRRLWTDEPLWQELSVAARLHAQREELDKDSQIASILSVLTF